MTVPAGRVRRLGGFGLTVADLARAEAFYRDGLGFAREAEPRPLGPATLRLLGVAGRARSLTMRLGRQAIELTEFAPPGRAYPAGADTASLAFQHFAIVARDMDQAYDRARRQPGFTAITQGGPLLLPPSSGSVRAFKFRDPDGHPLELLQFPSGQTPPEWRSASGEAATLGIDHSAIDVADTRRSMDFYMGLLGFSPGSRSRNAGSEQQRLDGLRRDVVAVTALHPAGEPTPHLELLGYLVPAAHGPAAAAAMHDIAATRLILEVDDIDRLAARLRDAGTALAPPGLATAADGSRAGLLRDPDGHALILMDGLQC